MTSCPACGKEIANGASVCKHCRAELGAPARPTGVTAIAILTLVGSVLSLVGLVVLTDPYPVVLGLRVPAALAKLSVAALAGVGIYCGIGLLRQKALARRVFTWVAIYSVVNALLSTPVIAGSSSEAITGMAIAVGFYGWILFYLSSRKDYFIN